MLAGRMVAVKRMILVVGLMVVGISLMLWAGWHNLRERRLEMQKAQENRIDLIPAGAAAAGGATSEAEVEAPALQGKPAPNFTLETLDGKKVSLSDYKGHPVLVNFWATWCGPCKVEMPWFEQLRKQYEAQGFVILGVTDDVDAGKEKIARVAKQIGVSYPILLSDGKVVDAYGSVDAKGQHLGMDVLPMSFYVDRNGVVVKETAGLGPKEMIEENIKKIVASSGSASVTAAGTAQVAALILASAGVR